MTKLSEYLHTAEAAEYIGAHHNPIREWAAQGDLPMHRNPVNGYRLFKRSDLDKFLKKGAQPLRVELAKSIPQVIKNGPLAVQTVLAETGPRLGMPTGYDSSDPPQRREFRGCAVTQSFSSSII